MTDAQEALRQVREALADPALFDEGASVDDTFRAADNFGAACSPENVAAILADRDEREARLTRELAEARAERGALRDVLLWHGFVPCDIPACNCGSWHPRFGYPERMREIEDALAEAGHPLSNENGNKPLNALRELIAGRDALAKAFLELHATVVGECPSLLNEDSGGSSVLIALVMDALAQIEKERSNG